MGSVYTVSQVTSYIKNMFTQDFALNRVSIKGEVSNCKYHTSGHIYFTLKDGGAQIAAVMFAGQRKGLDFTLAEGQEVIVSGTVDVYEKAIEQPLEVPVRKQSRAWCSCYLSCDIGAYDTCGHLCRYCYANNDVRMVQRHRMDHDKHSPFLIGGYRDGDIIHQVPQQSWIRGEQNLFEI